jgi:hypothetical protein
METSEGVRLSQSIREKAAEFKKLCAGLDEGTASRAPEGRWSPKEIISHLCGAEGAGLLPVIKLFLDQETPEINLDPGNPHLSEKRAGMSIPQLLAEFDRNYERAADFISGLSAGQLGRKAHVAGLKETPLGEYPTLAAFIRGIAESHLSYHVDHMREILQALGAAKKA